MSQSPILECPHCKGQIIYNADLIGMSVSCPYCKKDTQIPDLEMDSPRWFLARQKRKVGPLTFQQLQNMVHSGQLKRNDMLLREGDQKWIRADVIPSLGFQDTAKENTPCSPELLDTRSLVPCEYCKRLIATAADVCPGCGAPNKWVHPEIQRFIHAVGNFTDSPPFTYGHVATRLWGTIDSTREAKSNIEQNMGGAFACGAGSLVAFLVAVGCAGYLPTPIFIILMLSVPGLFFTAVWLFLSGPIKPSLVPTVTEIHQFSIDFSHFPPLWSSSNDEVWAEIKVFFFPSQGVRIEANTNSNSSDMQSRGTASAPAQLRKNWGLGWMLIFGVPCLLFFCLSGLGLFFWFFSSGDNRSKMTTRQELTVTEKYVKFPPGTEGDMVLGRYHATVVDKAGNRKSLVVNDSFMAAHFLSEDLYENIKVGQTYTVVFSGHQHHLIGLIPKIRPLDLADLEKQMRKIDEVEKRVLSLEKGNR